MSTDAPLGPVLASLVVDPGAPVPPYEQIRSQLRAHIGTGALAAGDRLPTVRALAAHLGVAVGTVARAYSELQQAGAVVSRRRTGTVVAAAAPPDPAGGGASLLVHRSAAVLARHASAAGLGEEETLALVRGALVLARSG